MKNENIQSKTMKMDNNEFKYGNLGMIFFSFHVFHSMFPCFVEDPKTSKKFELTLNIQFNLSFEFLCYFEFIDDK